MDTTHQSNMQKFSLEYFILNLYSNSTKRLFAERKNLVKTNGLLVGTNNVNYISSEGRILWTHTLDTEGFVFGDLVTEIAVEIKKDPNLVHPRIREELKDHVTRCKKLKVERETIKNYINLVFSTFSTKE